MSAAAQSTIVEQDLLSEQGVLDLLTPVGGRKPPIRTLRRWEALRVGPPSIVIGRTVRYRRRSVIAWLASRETKPCRSPRARRHEAA